ncbi:MAG: hypothetical protein JKY09_04555 [Crocinitomicaceae bacterium]|nr:hypothetical protein [Crocinitomicaceae bacterium]
MRAFLLLPVLIFTQFSFGQLENSEEAQKFWDDNIQAIVDLEKNKIIEQTNFPLELSATKEVWTKNEFTEKLDMIFHKSQREELSKLNIGDIDAWQMSGHESLMYMVACFEAFDDNRAMVLQFKRIDGEWKLYGIDLQK